MLSEDKYPIFFFFVFFSSAGAVIGEGGGRSYDLTSRSTEWLEVLDWTKLEAGSVA